MITKFNLFEDKNTHHIECDINEHTGAFIISDLTGGVELTQEDLYNILKLFDSEYDYFIIPDNNGIFHKTDEYLYICFKDFDMEVKVYSDSFDILIKEINNKINKIAKFEEFDDSVEYIAKFMTEEEYNIQKNMEKFNI